MEKNPVRLRIQAGSFRHKLLLERGKGNTLEELGEYSKGRWQFTPAVSAMHQVSLEKVLEKLWQVNLA